MNKLVTCWFYFNAGAINLIPTDRLPQKGKHENGPIKGERHKKTAPETGAVSKIAGKNYLLLN